LASISRSFKAILVERESHLLELCRCIVLNPLRVKGGASAENWKWSSYRATAGLAAVPEFLSTDWILAQFGNRRAQAQKQYREFVRDGVESRPWENLKEQIYLGSEAFIKKHTTPNTDLKEIPRIQLRAAKPSLNRIFAKRGDRTIAEHTSMATGFMRSRST
jgi:putative transposase